MGFRTFVRSAGTMSWIDPKTGLPEVDASDPGPQTSRLMFRANLGYRFANFVEAFITVNDDTGQVVGHGFTPASGIYRGPSFAGFPSAFWQPIRRVQLGSEPVRFTQIVGAQTKSAEDIGEALGGVLGHLVAHNVKAFPPIWTEVSLGIYADGSYEGRVLRYSIFPSMNAYAEHHDDYDWADGYAPHARDRYDAGYWATALRGVMYRRTARYDAVPHLDDWMKNGWGGISSAAKEGPTAGNPFNLSFSEADYEDWVPKGPG